MSSSISGKSAVKNPSTDLPPERDRKGIRPVSPPLSHVPLSRFNYILGLLATTIAAFYVWRLLQWKAEVGGWWNLALGRRPPGAEALHAQTSGSSSNHNHHPKHNGKGSGKSQSVEDRINALAEALGMPSSDLADAIGDAVRAHVPPASLSSVAAHEPSG